MNHLAAETSPYLLKHANDPVDWHTWNDAALASAKTKNKPIHLSIGYMACHWCSVLHAESFQDKATAALLNEHFINIKVDREERPDLDRIYQIAHQMIAQRGGGWPLTMFLTPNDQKPFFGGTYFPDKPRQGMPAFKDILQRVANYYKQHRADIEQQNAALDEAFSTLNPPRLDAPITAEPLEQARARLEDEFDKNNGGFGAAPKFPHPATLEFLLRQWRASATEDGREPDLHALYMATLTLHRMGDGGLFDQLGGGFYRYSVDQYWMIPHFEKMLYDNAALLAVYAQAAAATGDAFYAHIATETADWLLREMQAPDGGFYSSLDADSEGPPLQHPASSGIPSVPGHNEGRFYIWNKEDVRKLLDAEEYRLIEQRFGLNRVPNFEGQHHLHVFEPMEKLTEGVPDPARIIATLDRARAKLLAARDQRVRPARDEKVLTGWNAVTIRGLAIAARTLARTDFSDAATRALDFIRAHLWRDGRLLVSAKDGKSHLRAYLDDYVFLVDAILELQQCRWRSDEFTFAIELIETMLQHFEDPEHGGFYFTADDHEKLMHRSRSFGDDATPSGNAIAVSVLNRLGMLLGEKRYLEAAERTLQSGWAPLQRYPQGHASLLIALDEHLHEVESVIIRTPAASGSATAASFTDTAKATLSASQTPWIDLTKVYAPRRMVFNIPSDVKNLPAALADKQPSSGTVAYVCRGAACLPPVTSLEELVRALRSSAV